MIEQCFVYLTVLYKRRSKSHHHSDDSNFIFAFVAFIVESL